MKNPWVTPNIGLNERRMVEVRPVGHNKFLASASQMAEQSISLIRTNHGSGRTNLAVYEVCVDLRTDSHSKGFLFNKEGWDARVWGLLNTVLNPSMRNHEENELKVGRSFNTIELLFLCRN